MTHHTSRFNCSSAPLDVKPLLHRFRYGLSAALALASGIHAASTVLSQRLTEEHKVAKPLTTQFIKRQPRLTKALEMKKRPRPKHRSIRRHMVSVKARSRRAEQGIRSEVTQAMRALARPSVRIDLASRFEGAAAEPVSVAAATAGAKEDKQRIDMSLELLDIEALDTGPHQKDARQ